MSFVDILKTKNKMTKKEYPHLPEAFNEKTVKAATEKLKEAGYDVFDVIIGGQRLNMARKNEVEIYFDNNQAVYAATDYGRIEYKAFNLSLAGNYQTHSIPERLWCAV